MKLEKDLEKQIDKTKYSGNKDFALREYIVHTRDLQEVDIWSMDPGERG